MNALVILLVLLCPLSMGLMMLFMARSMRKGQGRGHDSEEEARR